MNHRLLRQRLTGRRRAPAASPDRAAQRRHRAAPRLRPRSSACTVLESCAPVRPAAGGAAGPAAGTESCAGAFSRWPPSPRSSSPRCGLRPPSRGPRRRACRRVLRCRPPTPAPGTPVRSWSRASRASTSSCRSPATSRRPSLSTLWTTRARSHSRPPGSGSAAAGSARRSPTSSPAGAACSTTSWTAQARSRPPPRRAGHRGRARYPVVSPVDGKVTGIKQYSILGRYPDVEIAIQVARDPVAVAGGDAHRQAPGGAR